MIARRYVKDKDPADAYRLVTANLRLVVKLAYEFARATKNVLDLIQEGNVGLMEAVKNFDPGAWNPFSVVRGVVGARVHLSAT